MKRLVLSLVVSLPALAADAFDPIRNSIRTGLVSTGMPSIAVAVARDGKIVWEEGFGWADREKRIPATEHTVYSLASISKPITATGLMILVQAGKVDLDKPVNDYLGNAKLRARVGDERDATVRRVANHSSGLPLHYQFFYADEPVRAPSMDETILRYGQLVTAPGEKYQYSNLGYGVLGNVIARVSGRPYAEFMRNEVFLKLGLSRTSVNIGPGLDNDQAIRYGQDGLPIPFYDFDHPAASAVYSSAHDLVRFGMFHLRAHLADQAAVLSDASIGAMQVSTMMAGSESGYGIGWATRGNVVSHTGSMGGVATTLRLVPSERLAVVVLCNGGSQLPHRIADQIMEKMIPAWKAPAASGQSAEMGPFQAPPELVGEWRGNLSTFEKDLPLTLRVFASGDVHAKLGNQLETLLDHPAWSENELRGAMTGDIGTADANRRAYTLSLTLKLRGNTLSGPAAAISLPGRRPGNALTQWVELKKP